jgi:hypothetical protein
VDGIVIATLDQSKRTLLATLILVAATLVPAALRAQISAHVTGELVVASSYLDRGVILTNQPVLQPSLSIALPAGGGSATIGLWATVQPASYTGSQYFSMAPGEKSPNVTEFHPSLELAQQMKLARVAFRATMRMFPNTVGLTKAANTFDVASTVTLTKLPFSPGVMVAYDIGAINGAYLEGRAMQSVPFTKAVAIEVGARAGYSIRQHVDSAPDVFAPYERNGFTHIDLTAGAAVRIAGAMIKPYLTYTYVPDPLDSPLAPGRQDRTTLVFGTSISVAGTFPKAKAKS